MAMPDSMLLDKVVVEKTVKGFADAELFWESKLTPQSVNGLTILSYEDKYNDIETPNDAARGRELDPAGRSPIVRAEGGLFAHTGVSEIEEKAFKLKQFGLEIDFTDEETRYVDKINWVLRKEQKLGKQFASYINQYLGNKLTESWVAGAPTNIQRLAIAAKAQWDYSAADTTRKPYIDLLNAQKLIRLVPGRGYNADTCMVSPLSFYDLMAYGAEKDYELRYNKPTAAIQTIEYLGINVMSTEMVKDDFAVMADFKACGILYEAEPVDVRMHRDENNRTSHVQITRRFNFNLTDPKAVCLIQNTRA